MNGGPVSAVYGWIGVSITNLLVALSMAEIVSAYPIAGGPYFWCADTCPAVFYLQSCTAHIQQRHSARANLLPLSLSPCCCRVLELTKNDRKSVLIGWITGGHPPHTSWLSTSILHARHWCRLVLLGMVARGVAASPVAH
jgi:amino acid transporter